MERHSVSYFVIGQHRFDTLLAPLFCDWSLELMKKRVRFNDGKKTGLIPSDTQGSCWKLN